MTDCNIHSMWGQKTRGQMTGGQLTMGAKDRGAKDRGAKDRGANDQGANDRNPIIVSGRHYRIIVGTTKIIGVGYIIILLTILFACTCS